MFTPTRPLSTPTPQRHSPPASHLMVAAGFCLLLLSAPAHGLDFSLPSFENLRPKFELLSIGTTPEAVIAALGQPATHSETTTLLGLTHLVLSWKDLSSTYTVRFVAGKLYARDVSNRP